ncbi:MAG: LytTR family DNA-binding domain-containing protein, partial [Alphaproteobacteria bacterium]
HYLRIHTSAGQDLILLRLKDAVSELAGADGMHVHRSYWVARNAVANLERKGRKTTLTLSNGLRVPVSESFLPSVREAGWLD